ncbi:MAG: hypothetical protein OEU32_01405 [Acidimicrobiia bacterium]|nr:hypothetical protein [Acidimicrobiia bacterium]
MVRSRVLASLLAVVMVAAACSGGDRPELVDSPDGDVEVDGADAETETGSADADADEDSSADASEDTTPEEPDDSSDEPADDAATDPESSDEDEVAADEPTPEPPPPPAADSFASTGTVSVALDDGRVYDATVGCTVVESGDDWSFRFSGESDVGVAMEGTYDSTQPDFVIVFISGPDALNGDDVLLSNLNGGDDLNETSTGGNTWVASLNLSSPEGVVFGAQVDAVCG